MLTSKTKHRIIEIQEPNKQNSKSNKNLLLRSSKITYPQVCTRRLCCVVVHMGWASWAAYWKRPFAFKLLIWALYLEQWVQLKRPSGASGAMSPRLLGWETKAIEVMVLWEKLDPFFIFLFFPDVKVSYIIQWPETLEIMFPIIIFYHFIYTYI